VHKEDKVHKELKVPKVHRELVLEPKGPKVSKVL
jgi:hypothetical protein